MSRAKRSPSTISALELLTTQHDKVEALISRLEGDSLSSDAKTAVFFELADNLAAHATIEETLFYPSVRAKQTEELVLEATEEHLQMKRMLADMLHTPVDDPRFLAKLVVLKEEVRHHAHDEEEDKLFPKVRRLLSRDELEALGGEMLSMFETLMAHEPRRNVPSETRSPAAL
jgi:hemerythrin superfamily protein